MCLYTGGSGKVYFNKKILAINLAALLLPVKEFSEESTATLIVMDWRVAYFQAHDLLFT